LPRALDQLSLGTGKEVKLIVERAGVTTPIKLTLTTAVTKIDPVEFREINNNTALLRVALFNDAGAASLAGELKSSKHRNLILDLRDNAGGPVTSASSGVLGAAVSLVAQLSPGGPVLTLMRKGNKHEVIRTPIATVKRRRILVLVNEGTANVAEAVASALKERGATVIGAKTFGDGTLQKYYRLRNGAGMTINAGRLASPREVEIAGVGVQPDIALPVPASSTGDPALDRAVSEIAKSARSAR